MPYNPIVSGGGGGGATSSGSSGSDVTNRGGAFSGTGANGSFQVPVGPSNPGATPPRAAKGDPDFQGVDYTAAPTQDALSLIQKLYATNDPSKIADLQTQLHLAGYDSGYGTIHPTGYLDKQTLSAYTDLLKDTAGYYKQNPGSPPYTPESLLAAKAAANNVLKLNTVAGGASALPRTDVSSQTSYTDPVTARETAVKAWENHLGRKPTAKEQGAIAAALHAYEQSNPTTQTTNIVPGVGGSSSSATTTGQANASSFADAYATADQGRANEAGALNETRFVDVLHNLMGGK